MFSCCSFWQHAFSIWKFPQTLHCSFQQCCVPFWDLTKACTVLFFTMSSTCLGSIPSSCWSFLCAALLTPIAPLSSSSAGLWRGWLQQVLVKWPVKKNWQMESGREMKFKDKVPCQQTINSYRLEKKWNQWINVNFSKVMSLVPIFRRICSLPYYS